VPVAKVEPVLLEWEGITCELTLKKKKDASGGGGKKKLLQQVTGTAKPGRLLAILGPSGSGKTTLLNVLAGQVPASPMLSVSGRLYVNGEPASSAGGGSSHHTQAYVRQQDLFYSQLTVRETLLMAARLRLPASLTLKEKYDLVENLMKRMGLAKAADTIVGDEKVRGISGGEKKRLSLACELIGSPSLIFADEPTSGLVSVCVIESERECVCVCLCVCLCKCVCVCMQEVTIFHLLSFFSIHIIYTRIKL
jgi:ABC-type multidrug transport system ATPase subunit